MKECLYYILAVNYLMVSIASIECCILHFAIASYKIWLFGFPHTFRYTSIYYDLWRCPLNRPFLR